MASGAHGTAPRRPRRRSGSRRQRDRAPTTLPSPRRPARPAAPGRTPGSQGLGTARPAALRVSALSAANRGGTETRRAEGGARPAARVGPRVPPALPSPVRPGTATAAEAHGQGHLMGHPELIPPPGFHWALICLPILTGSGSAPSEAPGRSWAVLLALGDHGAVSLPERTGRPAGRQGHRRGANKE